MRSAADLAPFFSFLFFQRWASRMHQRRRISNRPFALGTVLSHLSHVVQREGDARLNDLVARFWSSYSQRDLECFHYASSQQINAIIIPQLVERPTEKLGAVLARVRVPDAARVFSSRVNFQCRLSYGVCTAPVCNCIPQQCAHVINIVKNTKHWKPHHCLDTRKYCTH